MRWQFEPRELKRLIRGDARAWEGFVHRHAPLIEARVRQAYRNVPAAEQDVADAVQETFARLCARNFHLLRTYDPERAKLPTWLGVVAHSAAIDLLRRRRANHLSVETVPEEELAVHPDEAESVPLPKGLLSPRQELIIQLLYERDLDVSEVSRVLGINKQTVRSGHHKALEKLRRHFGVGR